MLTSETEWTAVWRPLLSGDPARCAGVSWSFCVLSLNFGSEAGLIYWEGDDFSSLAAGRSREMGKNREVMLLSPADTQCSEMQHS